MRTRIASAFLLGVGATCWIALAWTWRHEAPYEAVGVVACVVVACAGAWMGANG